MAESIWLDGWYANIEDVRDAAQYFISEGVKQVELIQSTHGTFGAIYCASEPVSPNHTWRDREKGLGDAVFVEKLT